MKDIRGFTLTEMLVTIMIISVLIITAAVAYEKVSLQGSIVECSSRLHQVGIALGSYSNDYYGKFPFGIAPDDFSDNNNWKDLWESSDMNGYFFSPSSQTKNPRLPRMISEYMGGDVTPLHCNDRGGMQLWPNLGPYYYNTTIPWGKTNLPYFVNGTDEYATEFDYGYWEPMVVDEIAASKNTLVACENPELVLAGNSWRHGSDKVDKENCFNNHWNLDGSVKTKINPESWNER